MNSTEIVRRRLHNQRLAGPRLDTPGEVVGWLGAAQSQDFAPAKWSLAERTGGLGDADLDKAFADGAILRTHVLRPTWHFVTPTDIRWLLELTAPRVHALSAYYYRQLGLDEAARERATGLLVGALRGGNQLTRKQLGGLLVDAGIGIEGFRLAYILMQAELEGVICSGAMIGKQHTYALLDERVPEAKPLSTDEALAELTLRYFTSHGPATARDFKWWSSLTMADIKRGLDMNGSRLERAEADGLAYWFAPAPPPAPEPAPTVHLLQAYDEYTVAYSESRHLLNRAGTAIAPPSGRPVYNQVVILDSQVAGFWKRTLARDSVTIAAALFAPLDAAQAAALQAAADQHAAFLGLGSAVVTTQV
jgi:winged helix DNA-binding protein